MRKNRKTRKAPAQTVSLARSLGVRPHTLRQRVRALQSRGKLRVRHDRGQRWEFRARDLSVIRGAYTG